MRLTIISSDKLIGIDGVFLKHNQEDIDWIPSNVHAVQWYHTWGEIEYSDGSPNQKIEELGIYKKVIEVYENETKKIQDELDSIQAARDYWEELRFLRNGRLSESDWSQIPDSPLSEEKKIEWREYRQKLRDFPENIGDPKPLVINPNDSNWPVKPTH